MAFDLKIVFTGMFLYAVDQGDPGADDPDERRKRLHVLVPVTADHEHARSDRDLTGDFTATPPLAHDCESAPSRKEELEYGFDFADATMALAKSSPYAPGMPAAGGLRPSNKGFPLHVVRLVYLTANTEPDRRLAEGGWQEVKLERRVLDLTGLGKGLDTTTLNIHKLADLDELLNRQVDRALVRPDPPGNAVAARLTLDAGEVTRYGPTAEFRLTGRKPKEEDGMAFRLEWTMDVRNPPEDSQGREYLKLMVRDLSGTIVGSLPKLYPLKAAAKDCDDPSKPRKEIVLFVSHIPPEEFVRTFPLLDPPESHFPALYALYGRKSGPVPVLTCLPPDLPGPIGSAPQGCTSGQGTVAPPG